MAARILYCHCAYARVVPVQTKTAVLEGLTRAGVPFEAVPDLCEMAARKDPQLAALVPDGGPAPVRIAACYPRAVRWLFSSAGAPLADSSATVLNMRTESADTILESLLAGRTA